MGLMMMRILCKRFYSLTKVIFENAPMLDPCFQEIKGVLH
jgi:hypothetical protein